jgi:hypothetical protein
MGWPEILSILEAELANLSDRPERLKSLRDWKAYASREAAIDSLKFDESTHWRTVNTACLEFAEKRTWPQASQDQLFWIYARLTVARVLVKFFLTCKRSNGWVVPDPDIGVPDRSVLDVLLVRYWVFQGRAAFLGSIFDPMGPFDPLAELPEPDFS